tara:strand:- start:519 stop:899 length:381 start_codon:yes stop_codon:yes gene_type:complete
MSYENKKNKQFGYLFFAVFLILGLWPLINSNTINIYFLITSLVFLFLTIINSQILGPLSNIWIKFGIILGKIVSPLVMAIIFFAILTPISLFLRLFKKDLLKLKFNDDKTYWEKRQKDIGSMRKQF